MSLKCQTIFMWFSKKKKTCLWLPQITGNDRLHTASDVIFVHIPYLIICSFRWLLMADARANAIHLFQRSSYLCHVSVTFSKLSPVLLLRNIKEDRCAYNPNAKYSRQHRFKWPKLWYLLKNAVLLEFQRVNVDFHRSYDLRKKI